MNNFKTTYITYLQYQLRFTLTNPEIINDFYDYIMMTKSSTYSL